MKVKYSVLIPRPTAKRMQGTGTVHVQCSDGWEGGSTDSYPLNPDQTELTFFLPERFVWINENTCSDGSTFDVYVEYKNSTGSRKERLTLVPQKV